MLRGSLTLSLADLGGLADLAEGEGLSFDILEINMEKIKETLKPNRNFSLRPKYVSSYGGISKSKSYKFERNFNPAKTLNKMISKIPVIGDIVIPKEVGEGLWNKF